MADNKQAVVAADNTQMEQRIRARVQALSYLPTSAAVAMKFVELGKDPEADPADYAKVIGSDASLASKILALANSSWFGVRNRVTKPQVAVNLLGLGTIRTLAISYCITGLHNDLKLSADESRMFWSAALCKGVAARQYASHFNPALGEEAFTCGIFQDFALPVMYALAKEQVLEILQDASLDVPARLQKERAIFRLDHSEIARIIAQKLELPELFIDAVAFHHNRESLREFVNNPVLADAAYIAALFPHQLDAWNPADAVRMSQCLAEQTRDKPLDTAAYLELVQNDFNRIYAYFEQGKTGSTAKLADLLADATRDAADNTTRLVTSVQELMSPAAAAGKEVNQLLAQHTKLEQTAYTDSLTGALNREGFMNAAGEALRHAQRYGIGYAIAYLDLDHFKQLNDTSGHVFGDKALQHASQAMLDCVRKDDLVGRIGGDEFVIFIADISAALAEQVLRRIIETASQPPANRSSSVPTPTLSAGLLPIPPRAPAVPLDTLLSMADSLMYQAKRAGGNQLLIGSAETSPRRQSA